MIKRNHILAFFSAIAIGLIMCLNINQYESTQNELELLESVEFDNMEIIDIISIPYHSRGNYKKFKVYGYKDYFPILLDYSEDRLECNEFKIGTKLIKKPGSLELKLVNNSEHEIKIRNPKEEFENISVLSLLIVIYIILVIQFSLPGPITDFIFIDE